MARGIRYTTHKTDREKTDHKNLLCAVWTHGSCNQIQHTEDERNKEIIKPYCALFPSIQGSQKHIKMKQKNQNRQTEKGQTFVLRCLNRMLMVTNML